VFDVNASGDVAPKQLIAGPATYLNSPTAAVPHDDSIYVSNHWGDSVTVYHGAATGEVAPERRLEGNATQLDKPTSLFVADTGLYVTNYGGGLKRFSLNAQGDEPPQATIGDMSSYTYGVAVHGGLAFLTRHMDSQDDGIYVYQLSATESDPPIRIIKGQGTALWAPLGLAVDGFDIYVANYYGNSINAYPIDSNGDVFPSRRIHGTTTQLSSPNGLWIDGNDLYVANRMANSILVFDLMDTGDVAPKRVIQGPATQLDEPMAVSVRR
jgi:6-phosphogluconolactonase (cycloisomerase 2 family)